MFSYDDIQKDWFNRDGKRNSSNTDSDYYNCGGFALSTYSWYKPYSYDRSKIVDTIVDLTAEGLSYRDITSIILDEFEEQMLEDFPDLKVVSSSYQPKENEDLIAFRIFYYLELEEDNNEYEVEFFDYDFHYRVLREGKWVEKCGGCLIQEADEPELEPDWEAFDGYYYDSEIRYYAKPSIKII